MERERVKRIILENAREEVEKILQEARGEAKNIIEHAKLELKRIREEEEAKFRYWEQLERSREIGRAKQIEKDNILKARHSVINEVVKRFEEEYAKISRDRERYREILKSLLVEAYREVKGGDVVVYTSKKDRSLVESILNETGISAKLEIRDKDFDGVILEDKSRGFLVYNTIKDRLERAREILLEEFSKILLGE